MGKDRKKIEEAIKTNRIILREITEEDADEIVAMREDKEVYQYFTKPHKITKAEHISWFFDNYLNNDDRIDFVAVVSDDSKFKDSVVGVFGIKREGKNSKTVEISYLLKNEARGKGYASEALKCLMKFAEVKWKCNEVEAVIHRNNIHSIRFIENNGFKFKTSDNDFCYYGLTL